ncbi:MAG: single-stranded-DNA-specific exonuclease RecJ [Xanthomonadales bacterium]|nr:single-stranded-DNA-specific exonuclease RecJ [Xanthomonadales bacterium]
MKVERRSATVEDALPPGIHPIIRRVLLARGVGSADALRLELGQLARPDTLLGLPGAARLLADAICEQCHIRIVGDFDADGATGTALAIRGLQSMGAQRVDFRVPNRFEFGYGLTPGLVETFSEQPPDLVVTVDSGISCLEGTATAKKLGSQVLITDHHLPGEQLPDADAIVNPNLPGDNFPSKALAGVGVMFYLLSGVRRELQQRGWFSGSRSAPRLDTLLDLVALGTVADLVPLDVNNRILVSQGLSRIRAGRACPGIMALLRAGKRDYRNVVASDLGFAVGPRLNAAGRLEDMSVGIRCLLSDDSHSALELAMQLDRLNRERRAMQEKMQAEAMQLVDKLETLTSGQHAAFSLCIHDPGWHQGVVGLVASKLKDRIYRPVAAFAPEEPGAVMLKGSVRSIPGLHIRDVLAWVDAEHPGLLGPFGGHAMAAGMSLPEASLDSFSQAFEAGVAHFMEGELPSAQVRTDGKLPAADINLQFAQQLRDLGPWGQRFPEPLFEGSFEVLDQRVVGGAHLKMVLASRDGGEPVDAIAFGRLPEDLPGTRGINLLYRLDVNHFRGERSCQLVVERIVD